MVDNGIVPFLSDSEHSDLPLPLIVAQKWGFDLSSYQDKSSVQFYCLLDWLTGIVGESSAIKTIQNLRNVNYFSKVDRVEYQDRLNKQNRTQPYEYVTDQTLYAITQDLRTTKKRPVIAAIKDYLAKAGVFADQIRRDPSKGAELSLRQYINSGDTPLQALIRVRTKLSNFAINQSAQFSHHTHKPQYATLAKTLDKSLFDQSRDMLIEHMNLAEQEAKHFRDHLSIWALQAIEAIEIASSAEMDKSGDGTLHTKQQQEIIRKYVAMYAPSFKNAAESLGFDFVTGQKLLKGGN